MVEQYHPQTEQERIHFLAGEITALVQAHVQGFNPQVIEATYAYPQAVCHNNYATDFRYDYAMTLGYEVLQGISTKAFPIATVTIQRKSWPEWEEEKNNPWEDQSVTFTIGKRLLLKTGSKFEYYSGADDYYVPDYRTLNDQRSDDDLFDVTYWPPLKVRVEELADLRAELVNPGRDTRFLERISFP